MFELQDGDDDDAWHNPIATTNVGNTGLYGTEKVRNLKAASYENSSAIIVLETRFKRQINIIK